MRPIRFSSVHLCIFCLLFLEIHQHALQAAPAHRSHELGSQVIHHHAIQEAPAQSSHRHPDSPESLKDLHLEFQGPNRPEENTEHGQSRELGSQVIHHHAIQEAPAQSSHRHPDSQESLKDPQLEFQGQNRPEDNTDHGQSRELGSQVIHHHAIQEAPAQSSHRHPDSHESLKDPHLEFQGPNRPEVSTDHGQSRELASQVIHHHAIQEAPAQSSHRHPDSQESLKDLHLEFQGPNRPKDSTDHGQSRELGSQLIHHHGLQEAPAPRSHHHQDSHKSLKEPHLELQGQNRPEDNTEYGQSRELGSQLIHHHGLQAAPASRSHYHRDSHKSLKEPHLEFQGPNRPEDNTDHGKSRELGSQVIHHHAIQEAPAQSSQRHPDSHESLKDPHLEFQGPNRPKDSTDHGQSRELASQVIHHHAIQEAPAQSSHRHPDSQESFKDPQLEFQGQNRPEDNTDHGQSRELASQVIHHHAIQEPPAHSSHRYLDSHKSPKEPHLEFQGPNRPEDSTDRGQTRELASQVIHHHAIQEAPAQSSHRHPDSQESLKDPQLEFQGQNRPEDNTDHGQSRELASQVIHQHAIQEPPAHSSQRHPDSHESLKKPHLELQGQNRPEDNTEYGQSRELGSQLIHHHGLQAAPASRSHHHRDSHKSLKEPHLEFQGPNRPEDNTDHGKSRELGSQVIHHHAIQEAPAQSSQRHPDSHESLKDPHLEFQGPNRPKDSTDHGQSRELASQVIHHHAIQEAPAQSSHRHPDSPESLKDPHLEFQGPNRPEENTEHGQSRELGSQVIHHHAIQEAPAQSSHRHPDSHESLKDPHLEFQGPNRPKDSTDHGQSRELASQVIHHHAIQEVPA
ncbi:filaggrin-like isoform X2 [Drosophila miranda]|uniref:filaggrin-like isoform X2 n=1 Tax=Drosophila miranda TaxID=7229 RepID=UPI00143FA969|nr:filaggrin-like isoform X2 [Drosophila miranda]